MANNFSGNKMPLSMKLSLGGLAVFLLILVVSVYFLYG